MAVVEIVMPQLGLTMEAGTILEWLKADGDEITTGQPLFVVETDKATVEVEAQASGILYILSDVTGEELPVGTVVGHIEAQAAAERRPASEEAKTTALERKETEAPWAMVTPESALPPRPDAKPPAEPAQPQPGPPSPWAMVTPERVLPSSPVATSEQVAQVGPVRPAAQPQTVQAAQDKGLAALSGVRKVIAERMAASAHTTARVTLMAEADATRLVQLRRRLKAWLEGSGGAVPTFNDLMAKLVAHALAEHPVLNATLTGQGIVQSPLTHVGLAVDTPRGLLVPVIRDVQAKRLVDVAEEARRLVEQAHSGQISPDDLQGGTFTITSLGIYDIDAFTPIINLPECAVLGIGSIRPRPMVADDGQLVARETVALSLAFDHRVVDGAPAARFLQRVKELVEQPDVALLA